MRFELVLMAFACLLTHRVIPKSQLIFPALGILSATFFSDSIYQFILIGFSCLLWVIVQKE